MYNSNLCVERSNLLRKYLYSQRRGSVKLTGVKHARLYKLYLYAIRAM